MKRKPKITYSKFEVSDCLDNEKVISEYLSIAAQDENPDPLLKALFDVAKARDALVAKDSSLGRKSLDKALTQGAKPRYETVAAVTRALNVKIEMG
jgi:probable addiction module antidote protein